MIKKISARLQKTHFKYKTNKEQQLLNNFVTLHGNHVNRQAYNEIQGAQKVIANYVMKHGVGIDIYDAREAVQNGYASKRHTSEDLTNKLLVKATNLLNGLSDEKLISANTSHTHIHRKENSIIFDIPQDGLQYSRIVTSTYEDNFLRNLYRNIQEMTEKITK